MEKEGKSMGIGNTPLTWLKSEGGKRGSEAKDDKRKRVGAVQIPN